jgi:hypothetical protein
VGLSYRRRARIGKNTYLNASKSGLSVSRRIGPVTVNSRGRTTVRLGKGLTYRASKGGCVVVLALPIAVALATGWLTLR